MQKKISIITVNYNNKIGLEKTIQSVVNQNYTDFEFIIIDGNSTDRSQDVIEMHKTKISYSISEPDSGIYNAMNKGINVANGEFLLFLNSGDCLINDSIISKVVPDLNSEIGIYYGDMIMTINGLPNMKCLLPDALSFSFFLNFSLPHQASFIKKQLFENYFLYSENYKIVSDWEFFVYCICKKNEPYQHLKYTISNFDGTGISSDSNNLGNLFAERNQVILNHFPLFYEDSKLISEIKSKRFQQIISIKESKTKWKILKFMINILDVFSKKNYSEFNKYYTMINNK